ncbi:MAG: metallophosphoesterase, partial [Dermatophilaceae bacterium]
LLAGDLVDGTTEQFPGVLDPLAGLGAPDGVYAVTGNHEYYAGDAAGWVKQWETLGVTPLLNDSAQVIRGPGTLRIAGVSDPTGEDASLAADPGLRPDLDAALRDVVPEESTILIAHQPAVVEDERVRAAGVDLAVSGHTHGGQLWPFTLLVPLANPTIAGLDEIGGTTAYTTRGAGTWGPPTRVGVPPEVVVLTLTAGAGG